MKEEDRLKIISQINKDLKEKDKLKKKTKRIRGNAKKSSHKTVS